LTDDPEDRDKSVLAVVLSLSPEQRKSLFLIPNTAFYIWAVIVVWNIVVGTDHASCGSGSLGFLPISLAAVILISVVGYIVVQSFRGQLEGGWPVVKDTLLLWWVWYKVAPKTATLFVFVFIAAILQYTVRYSVHYYGHGDSARVRVTDRLWHTTTTSDYVACSDD
jgi:hypothetical protein